MVQGQLGEHLAYWDVIQSETAAGPLTLALDEQRDVAEACESDVRQLPGTCQTHVGNNHPAIR